MASYTFIDVSNLAYRHYYGTRHTPGREHEPVLHALFRELIRLDQLFPGNPLVFCFDSDCPGRRRLLPAYKQRVLSEDAEAARTAVRRLIPRWAEALADIGYPNQRTTPGLEADDIIANHLGLAGVEAAVIVSSDQDFYQLLTDRVHIWNPHTKAVVNRHLVKKKFGFGPEHWVGYKALAGCESDNIPGVVGVGAKVFARYLRGELKTGGVVMENIHAAAEQTERNRRLVRLPFLPQLRRLPPQLSEEPPDPAAWDKVVRSLNMEQLTGKCPGRQEVHHGA